MNLVTQQALEEYLGDRIPATGIPTGLIEQVSRRMAKYCGRDDWGPKQSRTEYVDGDTRILRVRVWPIDSVTGIYDDADHAWPDSSLLASDEYWIGGADDGIIYVESWNLSAGDQNIKIIYVGGYADEAAIPADLQAAAKLQMAYEVQKGVPGQFSAFPGSFAGKEFNAMEGLGLLMETRSLIESYVRRVVFA
jgi:hypothetical protein